MNKDAAIARLETDYVHFRDLVAYLPPEAFAETVAGEWSLAQLLAHLAGWYREFTPAFARLERGAPLFPAENTYFSDPDAWNARFVADAAAGPEALDDFDLAFHEFYAAAKRLDPSFFGLDQDGQPKPANRMLQDGGPGHFDEHQPQIEAWLRAR